MIRLKTRTTLFREKKDWRIAFFATFYTDSDVQDFLSTYFTLGGSCETSKSVLKLRNQTCRLEKIVQVKMSIKINPNGKWSFFFNEVNLP